LTDDGMHSQVIQGILHTVISVFHV